MNLSLINKGMGKGFLDTKGEIDRSYYKEPTPPTPPSKSTNQKGKIRNLQPLGGSQSSPTARLTAREIKALGMHLGRPSSPAFERAFQCSDSLNRVSLTAPSNTVPALRDILPTQDFDLDGVQLAKLQRLVRKAHEKQLREDPKKRGVQIPRVVVKLVAMEELIRDAFVKQRIENLPYNIVNYYCTIGDEHRLRTELASGLYNVNQRDGATGRTALICAIAAGHMHIARFLVLEHSADVNRASLLGLTTPLHFAVVGNYRQIASMLITFGADVHAKNIVGATPLHLAHSPGLVKLLLRYKAKPIARNQEGLTALEYYRRYTRPLPEDRIAEVEEILSKAEEEEMIKKFKAEGLSSKKHTKIKDVSAGNAEVTSIGAKAVANMTSK